MSLRKKIQLDENEIRDYLQKQRNIQIGTINKDGSPHLTTMWYSMDHLNIFFHTYTKSQKIKNIYRDNRISILTESGESYDTLKGVLIYGKATVIEGGKNPERVLEIMKKIEKKYDTGSENNDYIEFLRMQVLKRTAVLVEPTKYISWDHTKI
tara:strand:- start:271 stop:729 length:459 start_codon:yes stop_codon:yes gene_type:complete